MTLALMLWACVVILGLVGLIAVQLVVVRLRTATRLRRQRDVERLWLPLMVAGLDRAPESLPPIEPRDMASFLVLWNRLHDALSDGSNAALLHVAVLAGAGEAARLMISSRRVRDRILAITTLGRLRDKAMWARLVQHASSSDSTMSLAAALALVRIDSKAATPLLLPMIASRDDWPMGTVAQMLREAGTDVISEPLVKAAYLAAPERAHRLLRYIRLADVRAAAALVRLLIRRVHHVESITACLRAFTDGTDLGAIRPLLYHPRWEVRVRAVETIGRLGTASDEGRLIAMLSDPEWWVRYRAAEALCVLLSGDPGRVKRLKATQGDPFARDILTHVIAERGVA